MHDLHRKKSAHTLEEDGLELLEKLSNIFIKEVNQAIEEGNVPSKSKKIDLIQRVAVSLHVFNHIAAALLQGQQPGAPAWEVREGTCTLESATSFTK